MKKRHLVIITILYTVLILYFMFLGFNRLQGGDYEGYVFEFGPIVGPLDFPRLSFGWIYDFGNIAAFIPFGILLPLLYRFTYKKFISMFLVIIFALETLQALTRLGSFDINDVISNTIGATIGYIIYKTAFTPTITFKKLITASWVTLLLFVGIITFSEIWKERVSSVQPLHMIEETTGTKPLTNDLPTFIVEGQNIKPQFNLYRDKGTYTFTTKGKKELILFFNMGIPNNEEFQGDLTIMVDGENRFQVRADDLKGDGAFETPYELPLFYDSEKMTISITGNMKLWDVGFTELKHWWE
ncbi:VanZ family protein [Bacillus ndiopicus]|uniref:VanZ family protein n=1 Tax=Bacillus ndiopicus TaxID=1347368 RepID=UPI000693357D|nr:VanZ family protein [Bacillus ndiopicus]